MKLKRILTNFTKPGAIFCLSLFEYLKKAYLQILKNLAQYFAYPLFQILKKAYLPILKDLAQLFAYPLFQI